MADNAEGSEHTASALELARQLLHKLELAHDTDIDTDEQLQSLRDTVRRVNLENRRLKDENTILSEELSYFRNAFERQKRTSEEISANRETFRHPPPEILRIIFLRAIPPPFLLDSSISPGPESPWCQSMRLKKSIVQVCRLWNKVGVQVLYEDIVFRHIGQIPTLLRTLENNPDRLGDLVKRMTVSCFIPRGYDTLFNAQLQHLLTFCPRIFHFAFTSPYTLHLPNPLPLLNTSITHLEFGSAIEFSSVIDTLLQVGNELISLSIHIPAQGISTEDTPLYFKRLESLCCGVTHHARKNLPILEALWSMPRLQYLTFKLNGNPAGSEPIMPMGVYESFCATHGRNLKFLHIDPSYWWSMVRYTINVQVMLDTCPVLEHLVLHPNTATPLTHSTVQWIDVWAPHIRQVRENQWTDVKTLTKKAFPRLRGIRILDGGLAVLPDIPTMIPPDAVLSANESFEFKFPGIHVRHDLGHLQRKELMYISDDISDNGSVDSDKEPEASDEDDPDFVFEESEDGQWSENGLSDSSGASGITASDNASALDDEFYREDDWEADPDSTINIYLQTSELSD